MMALAFLRQRWGEDHRIPMRAFIAAMRLGWTWSKRRPEPQVKDRAELQREFETTMKRSGF